MLELMSSGKDFLSGVPAGTKTNSKSVGPHKTGKLYSKHHYIKEAAYRTGNKICQLYIQNTQRPRQCSKHQGNKRPNLENGARN